jgi:hypothetical protein
MTNPRPDYLGDGVYAEFDGYHIVLKANDHRFPTDTIAIDPHTWEALKRYAVRSGFEKEADDA